MANTIIQTLATACDHGLQVDINVLRQSPHLGVNVLEVNSGAEGTVTLRRGGRGRVSVILVREVSAVSLRAGDYDRWVGAGGVAVDSAG